MVKIEKHLLNLGERFLLRRCGSTGKLLHAIFVSKRFRREVLAVYSGQALYTHRLVSDANVEYALRRNIHRVEKGLIMQPRRNAFATAYIEETVELFSRYVRESEGSTLTGCGEWYYDVLVAYFSVADGDPAITSAREKFSTIQTETSTSATHSPQPRENYKASGISYEQFFELTRIRRSVRWYLPEPVPRDLLDQAIVAALQSPSACNRQPFKFRIFDDPKRVQEIAAIPGGTSGFNHQFPVIIVVIGMLDAFPHERDRHVIYIDGALASMTFMLALETLGLSSCAINWPDDEGREKKMDVALGLQPHERATMLISVGYAAPKGGIPHSGKKALPEMRSYNT